MIRRIEARNYRCLRKVDVELDRFQLAVGPNASGKSTLFDVVLFLRDLVRDGLEAAVEKRTRNFQDLVWGRPQKSLRFDLALELDAGDDAVPDGLRERRSRGPFRLRHAVSVEESERGVAIVSERAFLLPSGVDRGAETASKLGPPGGSIRATGRDGWARRSLLSGPDGREAEAWLAPVRQVIEATRSLCPDPHRLHRASRARLRGSGVAPDGSNLPWLIKDLQEDHPDDFEEWMADVRTTLPEVAMVSVNEREDERTAYLMVEYANGLRAPSWVVSEGTLRFLLLSLIPFLPNSCLYLIEEPENGFHPFVLDAVYSSLAYPGASQVMAATHSTELVRLASPEEILCFRRDAEGATEVIRGTDHPIFRGANPEPDVRLLFSTGPFDWSGADA